MEENRTFRFCIKNTIWYLLQHLLPSKIYLSLRYYVVFHKKLNWEKPSTFSEKLHWLKLYGYKPEYSVLVDKVLVKDYVASKIGEGHIIQTLGVWDSANDIDFNNLPQKFVLKCNHNSGKVILCHDKNMMNYANVRHSIRKMLREDYYLRARETPYKYVKRKVFAESFVEAKGQSSLTDYKFYCFNGEPQYVLVVQGRDDESRSFDYFDMNWNHLDVCDYGEKNAVEIPSCPVSFQEMKRIATVLSEGIPHVRVDLFEVDSTVLFGELTFYDAGGFAVYNTMNWDEELGRLLILPEKK